MIQERFGQRQSFDQFNNLVRCLVLSCVGSNRPLEPNGTFGAIPGKPASRRAEWNADFGRHPCQRLAILKMPFKQKQPPGSISRPGLHGLIIRHGDRFLPLTPVRKGNLHRTAGNLAAMHRKAAANPSHLDGTIKLSLRDPLPYTCAMTNTLIGYARCSTDKQDLAAQEAALASLRARRWLFVKQR